MPKAISFKNDQQKKESIISSLKQLKESIGWQVIIKAMKADVKAAEARLHGETPLDPEKDESIGEWQRTRNDRIAMINLPDKLIEENEKQEAFEPNLDPYE